MAFLEGRFRDGDSLRIDVEEGGGVLTFTVPSTSKEASEPRGFG